MDIQKKLFDLRDEKYGDFQAKLIPTVPAELFIGVRVPELRKLAKEYFREAGHEDFMNSLPHKYYDENMLHALLIDQIKDYSLCIAETERFLPYIDNWAVCDILSPKVYKKHKHELIKQIKKWAGSKNTYTCRFGIEMLMSHFLDEDFIPSYLEIPAKVRSEEYYVKMMLAWFFATALAKQWDETVKYLIDGRLDKWVHNKTIQKAGESFRITDEQKIFLKELKKGANYEKG